MVSSSDYVSLHTHSHYSVLDGYGSLKEYTDRISDIGQTGLGLSDHGNTHGTYELVQLCKERDLVPIPGCEFYMAPENPEGAKVSTQVFYGPVTEAGKPKSPGDVSGSGAFLHQTIWAYNQEGLSNLNKLSTLSYLPEHVYSKPRIDFDMLAEHSGGLIVATGCPSSEISTRFRLGQNKEAINYAYRLKEVFGNRLFVEIMDHNMSIDMERELLTKQLSMSKKLKIPLLATNDSHYCNSSDARYHEEMLAAQVGRKMSEPTMGEARGGRFAFDGNQYYLKTAQEMASIFPDDEFPNALKNSVRIAEMCQDLDIDYNAHVSPYAIVPEGHTPKSYLLEKINEGKARYIEGKSEEEIREINERLNKEWKIIVPNGFASYMLIVAENIEWTNQKYAVRDSNGNPLSYPTGPGRGSVGGCLIAFLLGISRTDPLKYGLSMERFLSDGRGNFFGIEFEDGDFIEEIASKKFKISTPNGIISKYAHELEQGDEVIIDGRKVEI